MIALLLLVQSAVGAGTERPELVAIAAIVEPYARCQFAREPEIRALQDQWSNAASRQRANATDTAAAAQAERLMQELAVLNRDIEESCGYENTQQLVRDRLQQLHPQMDSARAYWLARYAFNTLNRLNETIVRSEAGVFPPSPPPPPDHPSRGAER